ncbi:MAG TPA: DUF4402 domain-containing protein [Caulobacteraceae bacterium]|jgi:hypothetical protein
MSLRRFHRFARPAAPLLALAFAGAVQAQTYTVSSITANTPNLGNVVSATTGDTIFTITASTGAVTRASGTGVRVTTGTTRATVTVACGNFSSCTSTNVDVRVGSIGTPTGRGKALTNFNVGMGTATLVTAASGTNPISFRLGPIGRSSSKTFYVGANFPIAADNSGVATGAASSRFYVYVAPAGTTPTTGSTAGTAIATVYRPIAVSLGSNLAFGSIIRPLSGSGTVTVAAANGARTLSGAGALNIPAPARAVYNVTGEGGQAFSVAVPASFVMNRTGGGSLTVTTSTTATASQTLSAALGSAGSYSFGVGGSFPLTNTTQTGAYSGSFSVTVQYN